MATAFGLEQGPAPQEHWSLAKRAAFRFVCCYFILYSMPSTGRVNILAWVPGAAVVLKPWVSMWKAICPWVAVHMFGLSGQPVTYFPTGSGDTTLAYIENLMFLVVALGATLVWSVLDRRRPHYRTLHAWLRLLVRYTLAFTLFSYGFAKVAPLQFQPPRLSRLIETYGEFSPMGVLWNFMGSSLPYTMFSGACEVLGGLLLLFRRTTTLGALVAMAAMANVVALNFCYDVPVKLYSTNLLVMSVFLLAPELRRLANFFVLNRAVGPAETLTVQFAHPGLRIASKVLWILVLVYVLGWTQVVGAWRGYQETYVTVVRPPAYGIYDVESFRRDGQELTLASDASRWRKVAIQQGAIVVRTMDDRATAYGGKFDAPKSTFAIGNGGELRWRPEGDGLVLEGTVGRSAVAARLRKVDMSRLLLVSRGFHWVQESPFNR